ncbi:MAG: NAD(P)/FAD-dependent oxidoreductase [Clostridia bacterium]|nr:NAD(P)/FAD-dependent oxidoreductase [Clostridia bacterium]
MREIIVVGGGAAGMMAAVSAASVSPEVGVTLLERNEKPGKKLYITGKGRCNVTNDCTRDEFLREVARNPRFLYSALSAFSPQDMMAFLEKEKCPVTVQRGRRVFPASEKASDVTKALVRAMGERGVRLRLNARAASLLTEEGACRGVVLEGGETLRADAVILATGGLSAPLTGSTGDGYFFAEATGHQVEKPLPSLTAMEASVPWPGELQGLSLRNVTLTLTEKGKTRYSELGEMLFTHFGYSGPLVLEMSCHLPEDFSSCALSLNLKPGLSPEQLDARLQREFAAAPRKQLATVLCGLMPAALAGVFPGLCALDGEKKCADITREERQTLVRMLQALPLPMARRRPIAEAIVTRGGVSVKDVNPATMASRRLPGLYFAGELLDVDAHTGGYNLQIAFSTGYLAGRSAAEG